MKRLKCEMCGCTEIIKEYGVFVCQLCGTKYSVEEARKMMFEEGEVAEAMDNNISAESENDIAYKAENNKKISVKTLSDQQKKKAKKLTLILIPIISVIAALAILFNTLVGSNEKRKDIISTGDYHTVGVKSDGTVIATGRDEFGQCDVSDWNLFK